MDFLTFDTETQHGKAFLACVDNGKDIDNILINTEQHVIKFLHQLHAKGKTAFAYNLEYDVCALLKYFGYKAILNLYLQKSLLYDNMFIRSVPNKFLIITKYHFKKKELSYPELVKMLGASSVKEDNSADRIIFLISEHNKKQNKSNKITGKAFYAFDLWQFYEMSLDKASSKYLGESKDKMPDGWISKLKTKFKNPRNAKLILKYCRKDVRLTHKLAAKFIGMLHDCGIRPKRFYSLAYIAKNFIKSKVDVPIINEDYDNGNGKEIIKFMKPVFRGGRTEVFQRGTFKNSVLSDMNSAYGKPLADLKRIMHAELKSKIDKSADYFFIDCEIDLPKRYISPVPIQFNMWKYPYGKMRATIDNMTYKNVLKAGGTITKTYRVLNVYCDNTYPFRKVIRQMFNQRKKSESHKYVFKGIIVAYIGKLHEQKSFIRMLSESEKPRVLRNMEQYGKKQSDFEEIIKVNCPDCYSLGQVLNSCRNQMCVEYRKEYRGVEVPPTLHYMGENIFATEKKLGNGTNIIYAALVTATIRNIIYERGVELGDNLIAFLTDGILSKTPLKKYGTKLGEFSKKYEGELYLLGSGMYQTSEQVKFRGFNSEKVNLKELAEKNAKKQVLKVPTTERTGIGRAVGSVAKFNNFNVIKADTKDLNVNFDTNRIWEKPFKNYGEALKTHINSEPIGI